MCTIAINLSITSYLNLPVLSGTTVPIHSVFISLLETVLCRCCFFSFQLRRDSVRKNLAKCSRKNMQPFNLSVVAIPCRKYRRFFVVKLFSFTDSGRFSGLHLLVEGKKMFLKMMLYCNLK